MRVILACAFVSILPLAVTAQNKRPKAPVVAYSCFSPQDYCVKGFGRTHDRDYYELCMLSERICRAYRYDWKLIRRSLRKDDAILNDCFPVLDDRPR